MKDIEKQAIPEKKSHFFIVIAIIAAFAGILFGYDTGVISGAILFIKRDLLLSPQMNGAVVSAVLIGAFLGAIASGRLSDSIGRKKLLIFDAFLFAIGSILSALSEQVGFLIFSRILVGIAIGISSYVAPLYISEISPPRYRGALVSLNQLAITVGIFLSYIIDYVLASHGQWRWMLAIGSLPAICLFFGMFFLPYSPRWLASKGERKKARSILEKMRGKNAKVEREFTQIEKSLEHQKGSWKMLFAKKARPAFTIAAGLTIIQQITGINTIIYYAPTIFELAGFQKAALAILATMGVGFVNVLFTVIALPLIDRWGRRPLLFLGLLGMSVGLITLSAVFFLESKGISIPFLALGGMIVYIACFAASLGPIAWLLIAEVFPLKVRGLGCSIATAINWAANWLVTFTFLSLIEVFSASGVFLLYFVVCIFAALFIHYIVPETKGVSLEEIEENLARGKHPRHLGRG